MRNDQWWGQSGGDSHLIIRARVCEAKGTVNLCTKCTNVRWNFGLIFSFTPHSSTRWMAVLICTSLCPVFSALLNNFSATCGLYFDERLCYGIHRKYRSRNHLDSSRCPTTIPISMQIPLHLSLIHISEPTRRS